MATTCTRCQSAEAIYVKRYSGEKLCVKCFCHSLENKVKTTLGKYGMLNFEDRIAVGVSGGKDSMALLHILVKLEKEFPKAKLTAITVDEGVSGYRAEALKLARKHCYSLGVEHVVVSFKDLFEYSLDELMEILRKTKTRDGGPTPCAYCGVLRRRALNSAARDNQATKLATAHNLDDETQTILLNILHGNPLRIARTKPVSNNVHTGFVRRIKPFCEILEVEIALYAYLKKIQFQNKPCPYSQAALRNDVRTLLNTMEQKHPGLKYAAYHSAEKLRAAIESAATLSALARCKVCGEPTTTQTCQPCTMLQSLKAHAQLVETSRKC